MEAFYHIHRTEQFETVTDPGSAEASYYSLGRPARCLRARPERADRDRQCGRDRYLALVGGNWINLRVPYPLGFYAKWMDARVDDEAAGWKGKGLWATTSTRTPFHMEGGKGTRPKVVKSQLRPDPLAR